MWDWEIVAWLRDELSKNVFFPYNAEMARVILRAFSVRNSLCFKMIRGKACRRICLRNFTGGMNPVQNRSRRHSGYILFIKAGRK